MIVNNDIYDRPRMIRTGWNGPMLGKIIINSTGDGDLLPLAGAKFNGKWDEVSLSSMMAQAKVDGLLVADCSLSSDMNANNSANLIPHVALP
jgi:hypothetical protein